MAYALDTSTPVSLGVKTWTVGFQADKVRFVAALGTGASAIVFSSEGVLNATGPVNVCESFTVENGRQFQNRYTDRMLSISEWNGSAYVETFRVNFDSITATQVKYNVITLTSNFQIRREAWA